MRAEVGTTERNLTASPVLLGPSSRYWACVAGFWAPDGGFPRLSIFTPNWALQLVAFRPIPQYHGYTSSHAHLDASIETLQATFTHNMGEVKTGRLGFGRRKRNVRGPSRGLVRVLVVPVTPDKIGTDDASSADTPTGRTRPREPARRVRATFALRRQRRASRRWS